MIVVSGLVDSGQWICGQWSVDSGQWTVDSEWAVGIRNKNCTRII